MSEVLSLMTGSLNARGHLARLRSRLALGVFVMAKPWLGGKWRLLTVSRRRGRNKRANSNERSRVGRLAQRSGRVRTKQRVAQQPRTGVRSQNA